jgi:short-subunit dehydrogenase
MVTDGDRNGATPRQALRCAEAGASEGVAKEASEEVAEYDRRMHDIERKLTRLEALQWITSAGVIAILVRVYWP